MKLFIVSFLFAVACADRLDNTYLPPTGARTSGGSGSFLSAPRPFGAPAAPRPFGAPAALAPAARAPAPSGPAQPPIPIVRASSEVNEDGSFRYEYETANGISAHEEGAQRPAGSEDINDVHGAFSYTGDDGVQYSISYTANEGGFLPQGAHIPTPPPIPEEIQRALEQNAADEARGIVDDGSYREEGAPAARGAARPAAPRPAAPAAPRPAGGHAGYRY